MVIRAIFPALMLLGFASAALAGESEWPQFRGPKGQGISSAVDVPIEWNANSHVEWKIELPGRGWSSPVLSNGKLYLTAALPDAGAGAQTLHALSLDPKDGKILWDTEVFQPDPSLTAGMHWKNSAASATPIVTADRLYVHFGHMGTAALDLSGKIIWTQNQLNYDPAYGNGGSPILLEDELIFNCDGQKDPFVVALDAKTGAIRWKTPRNFKVKKTSSFSTPLAIMVGGATEVISPATGFVGAYDPRDGHELWRVAYGEGYSVVPRPVYSRGLLFISTGFGAPTLFAIKPVGASGDATATNVAWTQKKGAPCTPSMVVVGNEIYYVSDSGIATCADIATGSIRWNERLGGDFSASPVAAEGRIYFQNEAGIGFVVKADTTYQLLSKNQLGERSLASYAVADGTLFIRTESHLWKITK